MSFYRLSHKVIFRQEYFGGAMFDLHQDRFFEANASAVPLLAAMEQGWVHEDVLFNNFTQEERERLKTHLLHPMVNRGMILQEHSPSLDQVVECVPACDHSSFPQRLRTPIEIAFYLSYVCNLQCSFCFTAPVSKSCSSQPLPNDALAAIIERMIEGKACVFSILGGEPTLHWPSIEFLLDTIGGRMYTSIISNGSGMGGLTTSQAKYLSTIEHFDYHLTLHSNKADVHDAIVGKPGSWEISLRSLMNALQASLWTTVHSVPTKTNSHSLRSWAEQLKALGVNTFVLLYLHPYQGQTFADYGS